MTAATQRTFVGAALAVLLLATFALPAVASIPSPVARLEPLGFASVGRPAEPSNAELEATIESAKDTISVIAEDPVGVGVAIAQYRPLSAHPDDVNVLGGYRGRYQAALGHEKLPRLPENWDVHHGIPQELRGDPRISGIDIDAPSELRGVSGPRRPGPATNVHQHITNDWAEFLLDNPNASRGELLNFRDYVDWRYEFSYWESLARAKAGQ